MQNKRTKPGICESCGRSFLGFHSSQGRFCSKSCSARGVVRPSPTSRLAARTDRGAPLPAQHPEYGNCWTCNGFLATGYAVVAGRPAHVVAYEAASGAPIPGDHIVLHTCDVRNCVRNDPSGTYAIRGITYPRYGHLVLGTYAANMHDASEKGRSQAGAHRRAATKPDTYRRGADHHRAVFTAAQARDIRDRYRAGDITKRQLAAQYEVSVSAIKSVLSAKTYAEPGDSPVNRTNYVRRGADHAQAILTWDQVKDIRQRYATGEITQTALAHEIGISQAMVNSIVLGRSYRDQPDA